MTHSTRPLPDLIRGQIIAYSQTGKTVREIADLTKSSKPSVSRILLAFKNENRTSRRPAGGDRKSLLTDRHRRQLKRIVKKDKKTRRMSTRQLTLEFNQVSDVKISPRTMQRELRKVGLNSRRATRVPRLTPRHITIRKNWAKELKKRSLDYWRTVLWTDESRFTLFRSDGRVRVRREQNEALHPDCLEGQVQGSGGSVHVWGCFGHRGVGPLQVLKSNINGTEYLKLLNSKVLETMTSWFRDQEGVYQDDNAPAHRSRIVLNWFNDHSNEFVHLDWPPNSPDMNPIEHLWDEVERTLKDLEPPPSNLPALEAAIIKIWSDIDLAICNNLIESMPDRINALVRARGGSTRF